MTALLYSLGLQWRLDLRNKGILLTYYVVPLIFFLVMGAVFTSINPTAKETLTGTMTIFAVTMGAFLGTPAPLVQICSGEILKAYKVGGVPAWSVLLVHFISGFIHLFTVSLIIFLLAPILYGAEVPPDLFRYFAVIKLFIAVSLLIGILFGIVLKSAGAMTMVGQLAFLPSLLLSGIMFPANMLPKPLESVGKILPATNTMQALSSSSNVLQKVFALSLIGLVVFILVFAQYRRIVGNRS